MFLSSFLNQPIVHRTNLYSDIDEGLNHVEIRKVFFVLFN